MNILTSSLQGGSQAVTLALQAPSSTAALIDGPKHVLWFGFGAFIFIFVVVLYMVIHSRVIAPSRRKASEGAVFEPAGAGANITFDAPEFSDRDETENHSPKAEPQHEFAEEQVTAEGIAARSTEDDLQFHGQPRSNLGSLAAEHPVIEKQHHSSIAGLFSKKPMDKDEPHLTEPEPGETLYENRWADERIKEQPAAETPTYNSTTQTFEYSVRPSVQTDQLRKLDDEVEARRRQAELADIERANYEQNDFNTRQHAEELREIEFQNKKSNAALEQRMERALTQTATILRDDTNAAQERLDSSIEERFAALSEELNARLDQSASSNENLKHDQALESEKTLTDMADYVGRELGKLNISMNDALHHLSTRIDEINATPVDMTGIAHQLAELKLAIGKNARGDTENRISLIDLVRKSLPVDRFSFDDPLPSGDSTDCRVKITGNDAPIVIDAHYPVSAFDQYRQQKSTSERSPLPGNEYRRSILHHIQYVGEKMIVPGETANSAMLFVPSEIIMNDLHNNFPDLIEDSHRRRVWIVSPTSLIATLHILSALKPSTLPPAPTKKSTFDEDAEMAAEIAGLRRRLNDNGQTGTDKAPKTKPSVTQTENRGTGDLNAEIHPLTPEEEAFERLEQEEKMAESSESEAPKKPDTRPPFPLR